PAAPDYTTCDWVEMVGRTPWSAAGPLAGFLRQWPDSLTEQGVQGGPRGPGGPPHRVKSRCHRPALPPGEPGLYNLLRRGARRPGRWGAFSQFEPMLKIKDLIWCHRS